MTPDPPELRPGMERFTFHFDVSTLLLNDGDIAVADLVASAAREEVLERVRVRIEDGA